MDGLEGPRIWEGGRYLFKRDAVFALRLTQCGLYYFGTTTKDDKSAAELLLAWANHLSFAALVTSYSNWVLSEGDPPPTASALLPLLLELWLWFEFKIASRRESFSPASEEQSPHRSKESVTISTSAESMNALSPISKDTIPQRPPEAPGTRKRPRNLDFGRAA